MGGAEIKAAGGEAMFAVADVSKAGEVNAAVAAISAAYGPVTVLFNHAGTIVIKPFVDTTEEEWDWLHDVNVKSMFLMTKALLPQMIAAQGRMCEPEEVARAALLLASDEASFINGTHLFVDNGFTAV